eukprot:8670532-Alexandrium_andersonii.AAC.1
MCRLPRRTFCGTGAQSWPGALTLCGFRSGEAQRTTADSCKVRRCAQDAQGGSGRGWASRSLAKLAVEPEPAWQPRSAFASHGWLRHALRPQRPPRGRRKRLIC